jgi:hypothetical protein
LADERAALLQDAGRLQNLLERHLFVGHCPSPALQALQVSCSLTIVGTCGCCAFEHDSAFV